MNPPITPNPSSMKTTYLKHRRLRIFAAWAAILSLLAPLAEVSAAKDKGPRELALELGAPFHDHAVLQRGMAVPVWGWSKPGTEVTVTFGGQTVTTTAGDDGMWMTHLKELKASFEPAELVITEKGGKSETLTDILVGEVWMASGQSNMQWLVGKSDVTDVANALMEATEGKVVPIREFQVKSVTSQLHPVQKATGEWNSGAYSNYSAIALAFAHKLYEELNVPVGILNCSWSQTEIQAWVPREGWASATDDYSKKFHLLCQQTDPSTPEHKQAWDAFFQSLENQIAAGEAAIKEGKMAKPISESVPGNLRSNRDASWMFNGRLRPVIPYAVRGAIWNQGFANAQEGLPYYQNLHNLVRGWRIVWDRPELPVYFHQFYSAGMKKAEQIDNSPTIGAAADMRLGTFLARDIPHTGMASQIDITGAIHYRGKTVPGKRLALHALKNQYGKSDLVVDGPMFKSYSVEGDKLIVEFDHSEGGLVVADAKIVKEHEDKMGQPGIDFSPLDADKVELFYLAGEDRVWHPASVKIDGEKVIVSSPAVPRPVGISYASAGVGGQPNLYNKALLPMTPFIHYDQKLVTAESWPEEKFKVVGETIDPDSIGKSNEYRKMPLLSTQFRDKAIFQADQPVTIWGSTRNYGEWQDEPEEGDCKVHFEFGPQQGAGPGTIKKVIDVTPEMAEWQVTLPPMKAGPDPYQLKVWFTIDGETVHERVVTGIVFGDVWAVVVPGLEMKVKWPLPEVEKSGQIVRMMENESKRDGTDDPSRFSISVSRLPENRFAARWKDAEGIAAVFGHRLAAKSGRPTGILLLGGKRDVPLKNWIGPAYLKEAPSLMEDYRTIGSKYRNNPHYLDNVRRYVADWKEYWNDHIPTMIETGAVPADSPWGGSWGSYPSPDPVIGDSTATFNHNVYIASLSPTALKGIVFLSGKSTVADDQGTNFGPEMTALAKSLKGCFSLGRKDADVPFFHTVPTKSLAPKITPPQGIPGASTTVEINDWFALDGILDAIAK